MNYYELEKKATPGPWRAAGNPIRPIAGGLVGEMRSIEGCDRNVIDAELATHCRNKFSKALQLLNLTLQEWEMGFQIHETGNGRELAKAIKELEEVK